MSGNIWLYSINVQLVKETAKLKKTMQNNDEKWPNFCNIWNLANLEKRLSGKYVEVYITVLILWKTHKAAHSNHSRQKKFKKTS